MERLKELRKQKGLFQRDIANKLGIDRTTYVKYETGVSEPDIKTLLSIAKIFNVSLDYLLGNEKTPIASDNERKINEIIDLLSDVPDDRIDRILEYIQLFDKIPDDKLPQALEFLEYLSKSK